MILRLRHNKQYPQTGRIKMSRYLIIVEETPSGYSAYSPDLPGCVAADSTRSEFAREMDDAIEFHLEGLRAADEQVPKSRSEASYFGVAV
jgi:predicted RNase H-like HicB family nuclease